MVPTEEDEEESSSGGDEDEEELNRREFALLLARDIALAAVLVAVIFGGMFAYTQVWPPVVVVESESMQHSGTQSFLDTVDTGDIVLVQHVSSKDGVVTWVEGHATGYKTYGEFGDVIIFERPRGAPGEAPIIHRPILYMLYNATSRSYDAPSLATLDRGWWSATNASGTLSAPYGITGTISMNHLGFGGDRTGTINVALFLSANYSTDGYVTMGDNNAYTSGFDPWLVSHTLVIGRARGEIPWFGLIKLTVSPTATGCCPGGWGDTGPAGAPKNSWDSLATSLLLIPVGIFLADYGFAFVESSWKARKRKKGDRAADDAEESTPANEPSNESDDDPR